MVNPAEMARRRAGEKPSSFSVTCSLLSQYLKEKGGFGDLGLGMTAAAVRPLVDGGGKPETLRTMNLLPGMEATGREENDPTASKDAVSELKKSPTRSMELFPQHAGFGPLHSERTEHKPDLNREPRAATSQMTIFYGGKVVVFDNFPADKARELMVMAGRGCPDRAQVFRVEQPAVQAPQRPSCPPPPQHSSASAMFASVSESKPPAAAAATTAASPALVAQESEQEPPTQPASSDLPIARRVSLHRFLEKRKDRINAKAPYQLNGSTGPLASSSVSAAKPEDSRQWLGLQVSKPEDLRQPSAVTKATTSFDSSRR